MDDWLILAYSELVTSVSRHGDLVFAFYGLTSSNTSPQSPATTRGVSVNPISSSVPLASSTGPLIVPHFSRSWRDAPNEAAPVLPQGPVGFPGRPVSGLLIPSLSRVSSLVGSSGPAAWRSIFLSSSPRRQLLIRRFGCGLGGPHRRTPRLGPFVSSSEDSLHQPERASSSSVRPEGLRTPVGGPVGSSILREHHHSSVCPSPAAINHGLVQCHSGRSQSPHIVIRSEWTLHQEGPQMASGDPSFCDLPDREASSVFITGLWFAGSGDGCSSPTLGRSPSLCLSFDRRHK